MVTLLPIRQSDLTNYKYPTPQPIAGEKTFFYIFFQKRHQPPRSLFDGVLHREGLTLTYNIIHSPLTLLTLNTQFSIVEFLEN